MVAGLVEWCLGIKGMVDGDVVERCRMKDRKQVWSVGSCPFKRGLHRNSTDTQPPIFHSHDSITHPKPTLPCISYIPSSYATYDTHRYRNPRISRRR